VAKNTPSTPVVEEPVESAPASKGHATPTRRERELARKRPLVSADRSAAKKQDRAAMQVERERQRVGMANGEEKFLPARDRGVQKRYVRDYVDARISVGEGLIPVMVLVILLTFFNIPAVQVSAMLLLYVFFAAAIIDALIVGQILTKRINAKYGDKAEKVRWYAAMRGFQLRVMRLPKPQVKRGAWPTI
jgi:hypothetical protein